MKKLLYFFALATVLCACNEQPKVLTNEQAEKAMQKINTQFVMSTVAPTYNSLADKTLALAQAAERLRNETTDVNIASCCDLWKQSRQYWEWSEAFLFGAASTYNIDPHIDTWPLDLTALNDLLANKAMMADIDNVIKNLNYGLLGYHAMEYILFREGQNRKATDLSADELNYLVAVGNDLALSAVRLEASWAGIENVTEAKARMLENAELEPDINFGEMMCSCGKAGSIWKSVALGTYQIIEGCRTIADEVAMSKIGLPYTGQDATYIESPHAYNSIQDFENNIVSIRNVYYGELSATEPYQNNLSDFVASIDTQLDREVREAIDGAIGAIKKMKKPFVLNYQDKSVKEAIEAVAKIDESLAKVQQAILDL